MRRRRHGLAKTYTGYSIGCGIAWAIALAIGRGIADKQKQHDMVVCCAGWWIGWVSATIARAVYPPPRRNPPNRLAG
jgi:hypothetical protein